MPDLTGKVAIVTGCASGIGEATLRRLIADGAQVLGTDVAVEKGGQLAEQSGCAFLQQDVSDWDRWDAVVRKAQERFGRLDILVNNAGMVGGGTIEETSAESWGRVIAVNLTGTMRGCQAAIAAMKQNDGDAKGAIVNIASTSAAMGLPGDAAYTASKGAVLSLTRSIAVHCARAGLGVRCNSIVPGATETGILNAAEETIPGLKAAVAATSPLNRLGHPAETAAAIAFLVSDECPFLTGADLRVDGGALAIHPGF